MEKFRKKKFDHRGLVTGAVFNTKIDEVESKFPNVSDLVKKTVYDAKISEIEEKYFTTSDYNKFMNDILDAKIKAKELVNKSIISNLVKILTLKKIESLATKAELKAEKGKIEKVQNLFLVKFFFVMMVFTMCLFIYQHLIRSS